MKRTIVILHGWGKSGKDYKEIQRLFEKEGYAVCSPDLPGFGSEKLQKTMVLEDYVSFVKEYLKKNHIRKAIFIGHSFGGRVAGKLTAGNPELVEKLILTGAPLIKQPLSLKKKIVTLVTKKAKLVTQNLPTPLENLFKKSVYRLLGEWDYYKAGGLKETFKNIINEDLKSELPYIDVPTYLIWGENDTFVPLSVGRNIAELIPDSVLKSIPNSSHKLPYESPKIFAQHVLRFLQ